SGWQTPPICKVGDDGRGVRPVLAGQVEDLNLLQARLAKAMRVGVAGDLQDRARDIGGMGGEKALDVVAIHWQPAGESEFRTHRRETAQIAEAHPSRRRPVLGAGRTRPEPGSDRSWERSCDGTACDPSRVSNRATCVADESVQRWMVTTYDFSLQ